MNLRQHKHRTVCMMMTGQSRFWRMLPAFDAPAGGLVALFREAAGIQSPTPQVANVLFDAVPGLVSLRRKKDGVTTHINLSQVAADEIIASAKKAKKASLEVC